jgi:alpha-tubulin suppressor-like RCC1 family protein
LARSARSALDRTHVSTTRARPTGVRPAAATVRGSLLLAIAAIVAAALAGPALAVETEPKITAQPKSVTVEEGSTATFKSTASGGTPAPSVQWEVSTNGGSTWGPDTTDGGNTTTTLAIPSTKTSESGNEYRARFKNTKGEVTSEPASLTVNAPPVVTEPPQSTTVEEGQPATFKAAASGIPTPTIQWEQSVNGGSTWTLISGQTSNMFTIASAKTSESGHEFRAKFENLPVKAKKTATSEPATLTVVVHPLVTKQPKSVTANEGQTAVFEAAASGFPPPAVQWEVSTDGGFTYVPIEGATSNTLSLPGVTTAQSGSRFRALFKNAAGEAMTEAAQLTVSAPPVVTEQPQSTTVEAGQPATFETAASGSPTPTVQWERSTNGGGTWSAVEGATSDQIAISVTQLSENGNEYRAKFTSIAGTATSAPATLTVASNHYAAVAWGLNTSRQLGDGSFEAFRDVPVGVVGLKFVENVSAGGAHSLAVLADGSVVAWGSDEFGQLGDGGSLSSNVPVEVSGLKGVKEVAAGGTHSLALLTNGTVMSWGNNEHGQLGDGTVAESNVPVAVKGLSNVREIAAGENHSLALLTNGTVMAWGNNEEGALGTGSLKSSNVPVAVKNLTGITDISAGGEFSLALLSNGTVKAWGSDASGQLANHAIGELEIPLSDLPVAVESVTEATAVSAGTNHALALVNGGTVKAWGNDAAGELGNGVIKAKEETPVAVSGLSGATSISAGGQLSAALLGSGSVMTWGVNKWGTLGDGVAGSPSDVPVTVTGIAKVADVSAGAAHMLAFGEPMPAVTEVSPTLGPTAGANTVTISGANLEGATAVKFGANEATSYTIDSQTSITATVPAGTGTVNVVVTTPAGVSNTTPSDHYTYLAVPTITSLKPKTGPVAGENSVVVTGTELEHVTEVTFAGVSVPFTIQSNKSLTAIAPPHSLGIVDVRVTSPGGTSVISTKDHYSYTPIVESVAPNEGLAAGGASVTVTGTGFALGGTATTFKFGTKKATAVSCETSTTCTMLSPAGTVGTTVDVVATVSKVNSPKSASDKFSYH